MIPGKEVVENEFRDAQMAETSASSSNINTGIIGLPIQVDGVTEVL